MPGYSWSSAANTDSTFKELSVFVGELLHKDLSSPKVRAEMGLHDGLCLINHTRHISREASC